jgi:flagellar hook-associated protein FlgK
MVSMDTPLQGLNRAQESFDQAASKVAQPIEPNQPQQDQVSLSDAMVSMLQAANDYKANLKSLEVGNEMQKSLLNILA